MMPKLYSIEAKGYRARQLQSAGMHALNGVLQGKTWCESVTDPNGEPMPETELASFLGAVVQAVDARFCAEVNGVSGWVRKACG